MTEIQGKPILVGVSARFEFARVQVIGDRLYYKGLKEPTFSQFPSARFETVVNDKLMTKSTLLGVGKGYRNPTSTADLPSPLAITSKFIRQFEYSEDVEDFN